MPSTQLKMKGTGPDSAHAQRWARSIRKDIPNNTDQFLHISEVPPVHGLQQRAFSSLLSPLPTADSKCTTLDSATLRTSALSLKNKQTKKDYVKRKRFLGVRGFPFSGCSSLWCHKNFCNDHIKRGCGNTETTPLTHQWHCKAAAETPSWDSFPQYIKNQMRCFQLITFDSMLIIYHRMINWQSG